MTVSKPRPTSRSKHILGFSIALSFLSVLFAWSAYQVDYTWNWSSLLPYWPKLAKGLGMTLMISAVSMILSLFIGLLAVLARRQPFLPLVYLARIYIEIIRGTPLLVQILIFFYVVATALHVESRYVAGILILSFFSGAYISEILRSGIESIPQSQLESARAIALTAFQTYRYVIFPQALRLSLPPLAGQFVSLVKDSSLLSIIAISELTLNAQEINTFTYSTLETYLPLAAGYLMITLPLSWWSRQLEGRFRYES